MQRIVQALILGATVLVLMVVGANVAEAATQFDVHGKQLAAVANSSACAGEVFTLSEPVNLTMVYRYSASSANKWYLYNGSQVPTLLSKCPGSPLANGTFNAGSLGASVGGGVGIILNADQNYTLLTNGSTVLSFYQMRYGGDADNPTTGNTTIVRWVRGISDTSQDNYIRNIWGLEFIRLTNSSVEFVDGHGKTLGNTATSSACAGEVFTLANTSLLTTVYRYSDDTATQWYVYNGSKTADSPSVCGGSPLATGVFAAGRIDSMVISGNQLGIVLNRDQNYTLLMSGSGYQMKYGANNDNPVTGNTSMVSWRKGVSDVSLDDYIRNVRGIRIIVGGQPASVGTYHVDSHGRSLSNSATSSACAGEVFNLSATVNVTMVYRYSTNTATQWYVYNGTKTASSLGNCGGTPLASGSFAPGDLSAPVIVGAAPGLALNKGQNYTLLTSGTSYQMRYGGSSDNPVVGNTSIVQWISGVSDVSLDGYVRNVQGIGFQVAPTVRTDTHNKTLGSSSGSSACAGVGFNLTSAVNLTTITRHSSLTATQWYLYNGTKTAEQLGKCGSGYIASGSFDWPDLSSAVAGGAGIVLNADQNYTLLTNGTDYEMHYGTSTDAPTVGSTGVVTWTRGVSDYSTDGYIRNLRALGFEELG